jgi:hypothetical protein
VHHERSHGVLNFACEKFHEGGFVLLKASRLAAFLIQDDGKNGRFANSSAGVSGARPWTQAGL